MAIHREPLYQRLTPGVSLPITEAATSETLLLPLFYGMADAEQDVVIDALRRALG
jgi:dTDP-4-amino-4,6-dideoxygalactose transaminase